MDMVSMLAKGGPIIWVLAGFSVLATAIVLERLFHFARMGRMPKAGAMDAQSVQRGPEFAISRAIQEAGRRGVTDIKSVAERVGSHELQRMESGLRTMGWLGNTAPLLGLLGTIMGMIRAFRVIEEAGGKVDAQALAGGIWEAMITTAAGLLVAIPILFLLHLLEGMVDRRARSMREIAMLLIEQASNRHETAPSLDARPQHQQRSMQDAL